MNETIINPTGGEIRKADNHGRGTFGASRGHRFHYGSDFTCVPEQNVVAPISGQVLRHLKMYARDDYKGIEIKGHWNGVPCIIRMGYLSPWPKPWQVIFRGDAIGTAQKISNKYPGMIDHIHMEIWLDPGSIVEG